MDSPDAFREQQALDWARRVADPDFRDWDAHMRWLELDPRNAEVFDRISLGIEAATEGLPSAGSIPPLVPVANDNEVRSRRWRLGASLGGLVAAGAAALLLWPHSTPTSGVRTIATAPGVTRGLALADGTRVALNGGSRLRVDDSRSLALLDGEAYFEVAHDADHPFRVKIGSRVVQDVGTAFDVAVTPQANRVSVREGAVAIDPETDNIRLTAGQEARIGADGDILRTTADADHAIGGWREGRLVYQEASWTEVVTDLSRTLGVPVSLAPGMEARRFTGVIIVDRDKDRTVRRLSDIANVSAVWTGQGWQLEPR